MPYQINFGDLAVAKSVPAPKKGRKFRLAVLGDFSARANRGELESGDALSDRKTPAVDVDNLDDILARFAPKISIELPGSGTVELEFAAMDDFHPDQLYEKLEIFSQLSGLRQRLKTTSTFAKAAKEMRDLGLAPAPPAHHVKKKKARGAVIATDAKLGDFARLMGQPTAAADEDAPDPKSSLDAFLRRLVAPTLVANKDPQQDKLVAVADEAIGAMMREVLHHPDFQALESLWRSVDFLVRRVETDETLQIVLVDLSAEEFAADLSSSDELANTALYKLLVEGPAEDARNGMFSAIIANYVFERTPPHADLLGRAAKIAAGAQAPFVTALASNVIDEKISEIHELTASAWDALRALPEAGFLGLALPRFMLRMPYGKKTDPIDAFKFEEFTMRAGLSAMLWANPAVAVGLLLAETFKQQGDKMRMGTIAGIGEMPFYYYEDADGDQTALPCTERYLTARTQEVVASQGFLPILAVKNSPEIRVGSFRALGGGGLLAGWWLANPDPVKEPKKPAAAPAAAEESTEDAAPADETPSDAATETPADDTASAETPAADGASGDADLDALLASVSGDAAPAADAPPAEEPAMDPELAKLLAELG